jgi:cell division protease FtsH
VIIMAATNRPDILDPALLRPGRFDRRVTLDNPDINGRTEILKVHSKGKPLSDKVDLERIAKQTPGFSGADLANLVNESAILAARRDKKRITYAEFAESVDRVAYGPARKSRVISAREKELTAYHESGHAVVAHYLKHSDPVAKVTIVSRGEMGGYTKGLPEEDRHLWTRNQFVDQIAFAMGGKASEEVQFGETTTGASNDLEQATNVARMMVTRYGMSEKLGPRTFGKREELIFLGKELSEQRDYSDRIAETIDSEVHNLLTNGYKTAKTILTKRANVLVRLAEYLKEHETAEGEILNALLSPDGKDLPFTTEDASKSNHSESEKSNKPKPSPSEPSPQKGTGPVSAT